MGNRVTWRCGFGAGAPKPRSRPFKGLLACFLALTAVLAGTAAADVPQGPNKQLSRTHGGGNSGNSPSHRPSISRGGRFVAFRSSADNLLPMNRDTNGTSDVFLWDALGSGLEVVSSTNPTMATANGSSDAATITPDGRFVVFNSWASDLPGGNGVCQTFLTDRGDPDAAFPVRRVEAVSVATGNDSGVGNGQCATTSLMPSVSDDGRFVGFSSNSNNLVDDDRNKDLVQKRWQVFVRDRETDKTYRLPDPSAYDDLSPNGASYEVRLSASGRRAVFSSLASDIPFADFDGLTDLFVWELPEDGGKPQITGRIDVDASSGIDFDISGDGRWVVFETRLPLAEGDDPSSSDAYRVAIDGGEPPRRLSAGLPASVSSLSISHDGRFVAMADGRAQFANVWIWDERTGETRPVVFRTNGDPTTAAGQPEISPDGRSVAFQSSDAALVTETDSNGKSDVHLLVDALALLDPRPQLRPGRDIAAVLDDLPLLASAVLPTVEGVAADGVTRTLFRFLPRQDTDFVTFRLRDENADSDHVGGLRFRLVQGGTPVTELTAPVEVLEGGQRAAFVQWIAPSRFARTPQADPAPIDCVLVPESDRCRASRPVIVEISYTPTAGGEEVTATRELDLVRPPVVLLHGIWSDATTFTWDLPEWDHLTLYSHDYRTTTSDSFTANLGEPLEAADIALERLRGDRYAATRADLVGHSMGGLLARLHLSNAARDRAARRANEEDTFGAGRIGRLITLGTPHRGGRMACLLQELASHPDFGPGFKSGFEAGFGQIDRGAVDDLKPGSPHLADLGPSSDHAARALVGVGGPELLDLAISLEPPLYLTLLWDAIAFFDVVAEQVFGPGERHDLLVSETSQTGGLIPPHRALFFFDPPDLAHHLSETKEQRIGEHANQLFNVPLDDATWFAEGFPASTTTGCEPILAPPPAGPVAPASAAAQAGGLTITSPAPGQVLAPGELLDVTVEPFGGLALERVLVLSGFDSELLGAPPFTASLRLPAGQLGAASVAAFGRDAAGNVYSADQVPVAIETGEILTAIRFEPAEIRLGELAPRRRPSLYGLYDSGIERDLTDPSFGAVYTSADPQIATVEGDATLAARSRGRTVLLAELGGMTTEARVLVRDDGPYFDGPRPAIPGAESVFQISGAEADAAVALFRGLDPGNTSTAACASLALDLELATEIARGVADGEGRTTLSAAIPAHDVGHVVYHQVLDESACTASPARSVVYGSRDRLGPPVPLAPIGARFAPQPAFEWLALEDATAYEVEVFAGADLFDGGAADPAAACATGRCQTALDPLPAALYTWRLRATDLHGRGPWSDEVALELLACDPPPGLTVPAGDIATAVSYSDCQSVSAGAGVRVLPEGRLDLHGGEWVELENGLAVEGELTAASDN